MNNIQPVVEIINESGHKFGTAKLNDVGHDLYVVDQPQTWIERLVSEIIPGGPVLIVWPWTAKAVASGIRLNMPSGLWAHIVARSSAARQKLTVLSGIIDSGYQGPLFAVMTNLSIVPRIIRVGERYAQVIFHNANRPIIDEVAAFSSESERGATGFGSTGK